MSSPQMFRSDDLSAFSTLLDSGTEFLIKIWYYLGIGVTYIGIYCGVQEKYSINYTFFCLRKLTTIYTSTYWVVLDQFI